jgi:hypothetical protein
MSTQTRRRKAVPKPPRSVALVVGGQDEILLWDELPPQV